MISLLLFGLSLALAYTTSPREKTELDRVDGAGLLDNGTPERPCRTTKSMCSKAAWFRARNLVDREVAVSLLCSSLPVSRDGNTSLTVIRS